MLPFYCIHFLPDVRDYWGKKGEIIMRSRPSMIQWTCHWNIKTALDRRCVCIIYCSLACRFGVEELRHAGVVHRLFFLTAYVSGTSCQVSSFLSAEPHERGSLTWPTTAWRTVSWSLAALLGQNPAAGRWKKTSLRPEAFQHTWPSSSLWPLCCCLYPLFLFVCNLGIHHLILSETLDI